MGVAHELKLLLAAPADAFQQTEEEMFGSRRAGELLDALLTGATGRDCLAGVIRAWDWAERGRYVVVACHPVEWGAPPVKAVGRSADRCYRPRLPRRGDTGLGLGRARAV